MLRTLFTPGTRLMNRLKYPQKFLVVGLILVIPLSIILWQYTAQTDLVIDDTAQEQLGLQYTKLLITFLHDIEQYTGIMYASAASGDALKPQLADLAATTHVSC